MTASKKPKLEVRLLSRRVQRELQALHEPDRRRILNALRALASDPRPLGCEKLSDHVFRVRVGSWRIIYQVKEESHRVEVGAIRRRSERTYRRIEDVFP